MSTPQPKDEFITVNGLKLHYLDWGNAGKPPLILLHGIARVAHAFDHVAPHFAQRYHVIAVDMRGHGESAWHPDGAYLVEDYTADIVALIAQLDLREVVLWGASTGGRVAQMVAGQLAQRVAGVIVEDVGPERPEAVSNRRGSRMVREAEGWDSLEALVAHHEVSQPRTPDDLLRHFVQHASTMRRDGRVMWKRDPAILRGFVPTELWDSVRRIRAPIIYVLGGLSAIVPPQTQMQLQELLPKVRIVMMPGLGHYPSDEQPDAFLAIVDRFLGRDLLSQ